MNTLTATELSNSILKAIEFGGSLECGIATGCRCMSCYSWKIYDLDDKLIWESDRLEDIVKDFPDEN